LKLSEDFFQEYYVEPPLLNFNAIKNKISISEEVIKKTSLFIYQPIDKFYGEQSTDYILSKLPSDCIKIAFPYIYFKGYWPQSSENPVNKPHENYPYGKFPYGDYNVINTISNDSIQKNKIMQELNRIDFYDEKKLLNNIDQTIEKLKERELLTDIKVSEFIKKNYQNYYLFHTPNHPSNMIATYVTNQILEILGIAPLSQAHQSEILGNYQLPIYPSVITALNLKFMTVDSPYKLPFSKEKLTFNEYLSEYMKQYT
jgi:hypothetical protein